MKDHHDHAHDHAHGQAGGPRPPDQPTQHEHHAGHAAPGHPGESARPLTSHHAHMVADFRRRFWVSLVLTVPVLVLAPHIQGWLGLQKSP